MRGTAGQGGSRPAPLAHKSQPCLCQVDKEPCDAAGGERVAGRVKVHREITLQGVPPSLLGEQSLRAALIPAAPTAPWPGCLLGFWGLSETPGKQECPLAEGTGPISPGKCCGLMLNPFQRRQAGVRVGCWWPKGLLGGMGRGGSCAGGVVCRGECQPHGELGVAGVSCGWAGSEAVLFLLPGETEPCTGELLDKHSRPMLDTFWVCFAFLWGTECLGCASRLALELAGGVSAPPMPMQPLGACPALPCGDRSPSCAEQALIQRQ